MLNDYQRHLLTRYLANIASGLLYKDPEATHLAEWISDERNLTRGSSRSRFYQRLLRKDFDEGEEITAKAFKRLKATLKEKCQPKSPSRDRAALALQHLGETIGLSETDLDILELLLLYVTHAVFESMFDEIFDRRQRSTPRHVHGESVPLALGLSSKIVQGRLRDDAPLVRLGLVSVDEDGDVEVLRRLRRLATAVGGGDLDVIRTLLGEASLGDLRWSDFDHVAGGRDHIEALVKAALGSGEPGVNILLYGPPGTGKTEFCKTLASRLGTTLYCAGEADEDGHEPTRRERLAEVRFAQRLLAGNRNAVLLFDEKEDLLEDDFGGFRWFMPGRRSRSRGVPSKVFMHRLLERAPTPTLWTVNNADSVSPAILRRMMYAFELRMPSARVRERVWARQLDRHGIAATEEETRALATEFDATPGVAAGATAAAGLSGGDIAAVRRGVRSLSRVLNCEKASQAAPVGFDPALIRADTDPAKLADRLVASGQRRFSLCLQGPPGTGKSAYVRYLAERLDLEVVQKRVSDLVSMWLGKSEKNIAQAFAEARDSGAFLVFDEADSLLGDRRLAAKSWEVSQVNEMLTWMESHPLPFACTTNFGDRLDPATLRRFVFKVAVDYLTPEQANAAFLGYFGTPAPAGLESLTVLTPGDFAVVRKKADILGELDDAQALVAMLHAECDAKPENPQSIGFHR